VLRRWHDDALSALMDYPKDVAAICEVCYSPALHEAEGEANL
jgi:hypothetical protein